MCIRTSSSRPRPGTPQGGIISPVVANMTLDGLEAMLAEKFPKAKRTGLKMHMVRYADDFIITGNSKEWLEHEVKPAVVDFWRNEGCPIAGKTKVTHIDEGFDFLGWNIRKYNGKLLMKPSKANVKAHLDKIREVIKGNKTAKQANLIRLLNLILRGWANYHRHAVAKETFARVDTYVWSMLWQWAVRRHPEKGARWVKDKYFKTQGTRNWVFATTEKQEDGRKKELALLKAADTPIQRHVKIKAGANPHDPQWEPYFETRWGKRMMNLPRGRAKLYRVWRRQDGLCPTCQEPIAIGTPWVTRFIVKRTDGGSVAAGNIQLHHPGCHGIQSTPEISCESGCRKMPWQRLEPGASKDACPVIGAERADRVQLVDHAWNDKGLTGHKGGRPRALSEAMIATAIEAASAESMTLKQIAQRIEEVHGLPFPCRLETLSVALRQSRVFLQTWPILA